MALAPLIVALLAATPGAPHVPAPTDAEQSPPTAAPARSSSSGSRPTPPEERANAEQGASTDPASRLVAPVPIGAIEVPLPEGVSPPKGQRIVEVLLQLDEEGAVAAVTILRGAGEPWDSIVLAAATHFRFSPAQLDGVPVAVELPFVQRFLPAAAPVDEAAPAPARITGHVIEKGSRKPVAGAALTAAGEGGRYTAQSGPDGAFLLPAPSGRVRIELELPGYKPFRVHETLRAGDALEVRYLVERQSYDPFHAVVIGNEERVEVARTSLRDREIKQIPGTFGDPFRVVGTLPGVGQVFSLLGYPIVRGTSPGSTGFLLDGVRLPQLFHYLAGPAVIHPEFIERVDFYPGSFPVAYGGYTGGIVDGITRRARRDEHRLEVGIDLVNTAGFVREPLGLWDSTATLAGRYGYPGLLLSAFDSGAFASYWDYQARLDGGTGSDRLKLFVFGSSDELGHEEGSRNLVDLRAQFHRVVLGYRRGDERSHGDYDLTLGVDELYGGDGAGVLRTFSVVPRARFHQDLSSRAVLRTGIEGSAKRLALEGDQLGFGFEDSSLSAGAFADVPLRLGDRLVVTPGTRGDVYQSGDATQASIDPRLLVRYRVHETSETQTHLKGGIGLYHQPPRFLIPLPGFEELALSQGLLASVQTSVGVEVELSRSYLFDVQTYFHYMDPILFDLMVNSTPSGASGAPSQPSPSEAELPAGEEQSPVIDTPGDDDALFSPRIGRSFGLELLVRKREGGDLFGWISYTLSRSERRHGGAWLPFDFDRTHMLHLVGGLRLPRNWEIGGRVQLQSGRPYELALHPARSDPFVRFDLRIDKRAVYRQWMLDFYIDLINLSLAPEPLENEDDPLRYVLPTVGFRAVL